MNLNKYLAESGDYSDVFTDPVFQERPFLFLTLGGSHAYGTNVEGSDVDVRGLCMNSPSDLIGLTNFEQRIYNKTDTVIYGFKKACSLFLNCNPNMIEMLGCRESDYVMVSEAGRLLLGNADLFLSQRAVSSFGGYATQQLRRMENAIARDRVSPEVQEKHILQSCQRALKGMNDRYQELPGGSIRLYIGPSQKSEKSEEILMDVNLSGYPLRDYRAIWNDLNNIVKTYGESVENRNHKKDEAHLAKHMMHLIRLYMMCIDILEQKKIVTYRENDHDLLMRIRNGEFLTEEGQVLPEFYDLLHEQETRLDYAKAHTTLPKAPNMRRVEELVMAINRMALKS